MKIKWAWVLFILVNCWSMSALGQTRILTGKILDEQGKALLRASVIAKSVDVYDVTTKWATVNQEGEYRLELDAAKDFELQVSYLGYEKAIFLLKSTDERKVHHFHMRLASNNLEEVFINYQYAPVVVKKDTVTFRLDAFTSGDERKLKEALEKLPGMEVDERGQVRFQGNIVNKTLVENRLFFGGGSRLAVENIPADAVDKIELISNFSEVDFLKDLLAGNELAMNVQLKADRRDLLFGDLEAAGGTGGNHVLHAALFRFKPEISLSSISNINSLGRAAFTLEDVLRFEGSSQFLRNTDRPNFSNLLNLTNSNNQLLSNQSYFTALHVDRKFEDIWSISGFGLYSHNKRESLRESILEYIRPDGNLLEERENRQNQKSQFLLGNVKLELNPDAYQKWFYNAQISVNGLENKSQIHSLSLQNLQKLDNFRDDPSFSTQHYLEWHKSLSLLHTLTAVVNVDYRNEKPLNFWESTQPFLQDFLPWMTQDAYRIQRTDKSIQKNLDALLKHYWVLTNQSQLHTSLGYSYKESEIHLKEGQILDAGDFYNFEGRGYVNRHQYQLQDFYAGVDYRLVLEKFKSTLSVYGHLYRIESLQNSHLFPDVNKIFKLQPSWKNQLDISKSERLNIDYTISPVLPRVDQLNDAWAITSFQSIEMGNLLLHSSTYHALLFRYYKMLFGNQSSINLTAQYNRNYQGIKKNMIYFGTNSFQTFVQIDDPESNWNTSFSIQKGVWKFIPSFSVRWNGSEYYQSIHSLLSHSRSLNQNYTVGVRTDQKGWPDFRLNYTKSFSSLKSNSTNTYFEGDRFNARLSYRFMKNWLITSQFQANSSYLPQNSQKYTSKQLSASWEYDIMNKGWSFYVSGENLLANPTLTTQSITEYLITNQTQYILPRMFLGGVRYKL